MTWDDVAAAALALPGTLLTTSYGTPAVKVGATADGKGGTLLLRLREDGDVVLRVEDGVREALIELQPGIFHSTSHYAGYPLLLVRPAAVDPEQIAGLIKRAWTGVPKGKRRG